MSTDATDRVPTGPGTGPVSRRRFLSRLAAAGGAAALLDACGGAPTNAKSSSERGGAPADGGASTAAGMPLARPNHPVRWPRDVPPIASGLQPESGATLQIYNWAAYLNPQVVSNFCKKYGCKSQLTTYATMPEGVEKLQSGEVSADVFFPRIDVLGELIVGKVLQPLNHSYIPNISQAWPTFRNPFYDVGWQYTVPYAVYTTGMTWRKDYVPENPATMPNGWAMPWQAKYKGKVAILDDYREGLSLGLLKNGIDDLNTPETPQINRSLDSLVQLAKLTDVHVDLNDFQNVPDGQIWIHQAFSGDMAAAASYMTKGVNVDVIGYWFPANRRGPVGNDAVTIPRSSRNPVLAHLFLDYLLDLDNALENTSYMGYMQPIQGVTASRLIAEKILPPSLASTTVTPTMLEHGLRELEMSPTTTAMWEQAWQEFGHGL